MSETCMSRHLDNVGKPRPPVEWTVTYRCVESPGYAHFRKPECDEPHVYGACDACAASLVDGQQRCARCFAPMVVVGIAPLSPTEQESSE